MSQKAHVGVTARGYSQIRLYNKSVPAGKHTNTCHISMMDVAPIGKAIQQPKKRPRRRGPRLTGVSKQRRVANARERRRVEILNMNIQILRHMIPLPPQDKEPSKTEVIWLAVDYITELTKMLDSADQWQSELEMVDIDSIDSLEDSPLFNFEG